MSNQLMSTVLDILKKAQCRNCSVQLETCYHALVRAKCGLCQNQTNTLPALWMLQGDSRPGIYGPDRDALASLPGGPFPTPTIPK